MCEAGAVQVTFPLFISTLLRYKLSKLIHFYHFNHLPYIPNIPNKNDFIHCPLEHRTDTLCCVTSSGECTSAVSDALEMRIQVHGMSLTKSVPYSTSIWLPRSKCPKCQPEKMYRWSGSACAASSNKSLDTYASDG